MAPLHQLSMRSPAHNSQLPRCQLLTLGATAVTVAEARVAEATLGTFFPCPPPMPLPGSHLPLPRPHFSPWWAHPGQQQPQCPPCSQSGGGVWNAQSPSTPTPGLEENGRDTAPHGRLCHSSASDIIICQDTPEILLQCSIDRVWISKQLPARQS